MNCFALIKLQSNYFIFRCIITPDFKHIAMNSSLKHWNIYHWNSYHWNNYLKCFTCQESKSIKVGSLLQIILTASIGKMFILHYLFLKASTCTKYHVLLNCEFMHLNGPFLELRRHTDVCLLCKDVKFDTRKTVTSLYSVSKKSSTFSHTWFLFI